MYKGLPLAGICDYFYLRSKLTLYKWVFSASIQRPRRIRNWTIASLTRETSLFLLNPHKIFKHERMIMILMRVGQTLEKVCQYKQAQQDWQVQGESPWVEWFFSTMDLQTQGEGYSKKFYTERLRPEVQPLTLLYTHFWQERYPFHIPSIDKWYPFYIPSVELGTLFNICKFTGLSQNQNFFSTLSQP